MNPQQTEPDHSEPLAATALTEVADDPREERRLQAAVLWAQGYKVHQIARAIGVSDETARSDLARVRQDWGAKWERRLHYHLNKAIFEIDALKAEYWNAWRRSCSPKIRRVGVSVGSPPACRSEGTPGALEGKPEDADDVVEVLEMPGDPRFLHGVRECIERQCKLLGLDAPERIQVEAPVKLVAGVDMDSV